MPKALFELWLDYLFNPSQCHTMDIKMWNNPFHVLSVLHNLVCCVLAPAYAFPSVLDLVELRAKCLGSLNYFFCIPWAETCWFPIWLSHYLLPSSAFLLNCLNWLLISSCWSSCFQPYLHLIILNSWQIILLKCKLPPVFLPLFNLFIVSNQKKKFKINFKAEQSSTIPLSDLKLRPGFNHRAVSRMECIKCMDDV